jgi:hypothetical protein
LRDAGDLDEVMAKFYPEKYARHCVEERRRLLDRISSRDFSGPERNEAMPESVTIPEPSFRRNSGRPAYRSNSIGSDKTRPEPPIRQHSGRPVSRSNSTGSDKTSPGQSRTVEIRCHECDRTFSTRAVKQLHTCNSILDVTALISEGGPRKTRPTIRFEEEQEENDDGTTRWLQFLFSRI